MTRTNLEKFREITEAKCIKLNQDCPELNVSFLQVLAILSFEKKNHEALKSANFLKELTDKGMFREIFEYFDKLLKEEKSKMDAAFE